MRPALATRSVLVVGAGGLGCPAARVLARSGVGHLTILDDDVVDESNLQRQTLYGLRDVGQAKAALAAERLTAAAKEAGFACEVVARENRIMPETAVALVTGHDLIVEGTDNFASKFLVSDACAIAGVPLVQAGAVRWGGWALGVLPGRGACLRCVFEDVPRGRADTCAAAGIVGPVAGVLGALQAAMGLRMLAGEHEAASVLWSYAALKGVLRASTVSRQEHCPSCSGLIRDTSVSRYVPPEHAA